MNPTRNQQIYKLWTEIQMLIGDAKLWPQEVRALFWSKNINYFDRFRICCFVYSNGLLPELFLQWCDLLGLLRDISAKRHVISLLKDFDEKPSYRAKYFAYNVTLRCLEYLNGVGHSFFVS